MTAPLYECGLSHWTSRLVNIRFVESVCKTQDICYVKGYLCCEAQKEQGVESEMRPLPGTMRVDEEGHLWIGGCDTTVLAETYGTPLFVYDEVLLRDQIRAFRAAFDQTGVAYEVAYACKAFCTIAMVQLASEEGCVIDTVSAGEIHTALMAGVNPERIHLHGNNKTRAELEYAVKVGIGTVIVDNFSEFALLNDVAAAHHKEVNVLLRIAPGVEAHTHEYISTGQQDSKFGFDLASGQAERALQVVTEYTHLRCVGIHSHIGSQIFDGEGFIAAIDRITQVYARGIEIGLPFSILNVGGGFGIRYTEEDDPSPIAEQINAIVQAVQAASLKHPFPVPQIWIEPGRSIAGPAGTTLYTIGSQKMLPGIRNYVAIDGGMTDNPRLALYGAKYEAGLANRMWDKVEDNWSVAGKCCESGDMVIWDAPLPQPNSGDLLAVFATGAYNYSMASHYNRIPNPAVVFVREGKAAVVVERESVEDLVRLDRPLKYDSVEVSSPSPLSSR